MLRSAIRCGACARRGRAKPSQRVAARTLSERGRHAQKRGWLVTNEDTTHYCAYSAASQADASVCAAALAVLLAVPMARGMLFLRHSRACRADFTPQLRFRNLVSRLNLLEEEYNVSYDDLPPDRTSTTSVGGAAPAHGPARVVYRLSGTATFHTLFGLRNFPLDSQTFAVEVMSSWGKEHVRLVRNTAQGARSVISRETFSLASEYDLSGQVHLINRESDPKHSSSMTTYSYLEIQMHVRRKLSFWVWNVWLPLFMVTGLSFGAFLVETTQTAARLSITLTILLTLVSYRFSIMSKLPKIDYLTRLDVRALLMDIESLPASVDSRALSIASRCTFKCALPWCSQLRCKVRSVDTAQLARTTRQHSAEC